MFEPHKTAYRHPRCKTPYRVKNWPEYDTSLRGRGDITVWLSPLSPGSLALRMLARR